MTNNPQRCLTVIYSDSYYQHDVYTSPCHTYSDYFLWRYDTKTKQLQNKGVSDNKGIPYCAVQRTGVRLGRITLAPCFGLTYFKFSTRYEHGGISVQFHSDLDSRYCIDSYGTSTYTGNRYTRLYNCESVTTKYSDQWYNYNTKEVYKGGDLKPPKFVSILDGNWGHFKFRSTQSCWAVDAVTGIVQQRTCLEQDDGQIFRYVKSTQEVQNWKFPVVDKNPGCVTRDKNRLYVRTCTGSPLQKFYIREDFAYNGKFQQVSFLDGHSNKCAYVWGAHAGTRPMYTGTCREITYKSETSWIEFKFWKHSKQCQKGHHLVHGECRKCPAGTYNNVYGSNTCTRCPAGTTSDAGAIKCRKVNNCPAGTFQSNRGNCELCPVNTFSNTIGSYSCKKCPAGFYTKAKGSTKCIRKASCKPGSFVNGNACSLCPINTFTNTYNAPTCLKCPKNYYTTTAGSTACIKKTYCGPGKYHNGNHCQECPRNTYSNEIGNIKCTPCPEGFETKGTGAKFCTRKNNCQPGSFFSTVSNKCDLCPKNTFTDKPHQTRCIACPAGTGTKTEGARACVKINYCKAGRFHNGKKCVPCPINTYSPEVGAWSCKKCPAGTKTDKKGSASCRKIEPDDCTPGKFYNGKWCQLCKKDTYTDIKGMKYCKKCPSGYETESTGSSRCMKKETVKVIAEADTTRVRCYYGSVCLLKCKFKTSTRQIIQNKNSVSFYELKGSSWISVGPVMFNRNTKWFSYKVSDRVTSKDAGAYRCTGRYGQAEGSATMEVITISKSG